MKNLLCWLGIHKWVLTDVDPDDKDEPMAILRCDRPCPVTKREPWWGSNWQEQETRKGTAYSKGKVYR